MQMPIRSLQSMLRLLQRHAGKPTTVVPDGIFGPETARAVREFQQQNGLPVTGAADLATWNAVVDAAREAHIHHARPSRCARFFSRCRPSPPASRTCTCTLLRACCRPCGTTMTACRPFP